MEQRIDKQDSTITDLNNKSDEQKKVLNEVKADLNNTSEQHSNLTKCHEFDIKQIGSRIDELDYHIGKYLYKFY